MNVRVLPQAQRDVREAAQWYDSRQIGLGTEFLDEFQTALEDIETDPQRFPVLEVPLPTSRIIKRRLMNRFYYLVMFEVLEGEVRIVAVAHPSCEPGYWLQTGDAS